MEPIFQPFYGTDNKISPRINDGKRETRYTQTASVPSNSLITNFLLNFNTSNNNKNNNFKLLHNNTLASDAEKTGGEKEEKRSTKKVI